MRGRARAQYWTGPQGSKASLLPFVPVCFLLVRPGPAAGIAWSAALHHAKGLGQLTFGPGRSRFGLGWLDQGLMSCPPTRISCSADGPARPRSQIVCERPATRRLVSWLFLALHHSWTLVCKRAWSAYFRARPLAVRSGLVGSRLDSISCPPTRTAWRAFGQVFVHCAMLAIL